LLCLPFGSPMDADHASRILVVPQTDRRTLVSVLVLLRRFPAAIASVVLVFGG
jgi:hypothetical protein